MCHNAGELEPTKPPICPIYLSGSLNSILQSNFAASQIPGRDMFPLLQLGLLQSQAARVLHEEDDNWKKHVCVGCRAVDECSRASTEPTAAEQASRRGTAHHNFNKNIGVGSVIGWTRVTPTGSRGTGGCRTKA